MIDWAGAPVDDTSSRDEGRESEPENAPQPVASLVGMMLRLAPKVQHSQPTDVSSGLFLQKSRVVGGHKLAPPGKPRSASVVVPSSAAAKAVFEGVSDLQGFNACLQILRNRLSP